MCWKSYVKCAHCGHFYDSEGDACNMCGEIMIIPHEKWMEWERQIYRTK